MESLSGGSAVGAVIIGSSIFNIKPIMVVSDKYHESCGFVSVEPECVAHCII
jgi:hypothetical protein